jgi:hypothetical protein
MNAICKKGIDEALHKHTADNATTYLSLIATVLASSSSFTFSINFPGTLTNPIRQT